MSYNIISFFFKNTKLEVLFSVLSKVIVMISAPIIMWLLTTHLSVEMQGYYYTFYSILALQIFFELGLNTLISNFVSHEWSIIKNNYESDEEAKIKAHLRLAHFGKFTLHWYLMMCALFILVVGPLGYWFFKVNSEGDNSWCLPWIFLVFFGGVQFLLISIIAFFEGCNQILKINIIRCITALVTSCVLGASLYANYGLWSPVFALASATTLQIVLIYILFKEDYLLIINKNKLVRPEYTFDWKEEVWPLQWRIAISGVSGYFIFSLFNPIMFHYHGPAVAARMGLTLQAVNFLSNLAYSWFQVRVPSLAALARSRHQVELEKMFWQGALISLGVMVLLSGAFISFVSILVHYQSYLMERLLAPSVVAILLMATTALLISQFQAAYVRAHKLEPFAWVNFVSAFLSGILIWQLGKYWGAKGAISAYSSVILFLLLPWFTFIWIKVRNSTYGKK